jgi:predicted GIY-YIG superfamily endonuclease
MICEFISHEHHFKLNFSLEMYQSDGNVFCGHGNRFNKAHVEHNQTFGCSLTKKNKLFLLYWFEFVNWNVM